jgi:hypothetical protein
VKKKTLRSEKLIGLRGVNYGWSPKDEKRMPDVMVLLLMKARSREIHRPGSHFGSFAALLAAFDGSDSIPSEKSNFLRRPRRKSELPFWEDLTKKIRALQLIHEHTNHLSFYNYMYVNRPVVPIMSQLSGNRKRPVTCESLPIQSV